jgi:parafibromin
VTFEVHDSVAAFTENQWKRVIAVFVNGHEWQFKDWNEKIGAKMGLGKRYVELFLRVRGYYLFYQDQGGATMPEFVTKSNIKPLAIQRNKRHQDVTVFNELWSDLEVFLKKEKF